MNELSGIPEPFDAPGRRVLVVEDEMLVRLAAADAFRDAGFVVMEAANADEALTFVKAGITPDAVFTDVHMPGSMDGLQLAAALKEALPGLAVLVTSGQFQAGPTLSHLFLPKPYDPHKAVALVLGALANP